MENPTQADSGSIFADPEAFERYFARAARQLQAQLEARRSFVQGSMERLQTLRQLAITIEDEEIRQEIETKLEAGQNVLAALQAAALPLEQAGSR